MFHERLFSNQQKRILLLSKLLQENDIFLFKRSSFFEMGATFSRLLPISLHSNLTNAPFHVYNRLKTV